MVWNSIQEPVHQPTACFFFFFKAKRIKMYLGKLIDFLWYLCIFLLILWLLFYFILISHIYEMREITYVRVSVNLLWERRHLSIVKTKVTTSVWSVEHKHDPVLGIPRSQRASIRWEEFMDEQMTWIKQTRPCVQSFIVEYRIMWWIICSL